MHSGDVAAMRDVSERLPKFTITFVMPSPDQRRFFFCSFSAMRAFTILFTSVADRGLSSGKRMVSRQSRN